MSSFIHAQHANLPLSEIDLIDCTGCLRDTPVRRQWLIEQLKEQGSVDADMPDQHDRLRQMTRQHKTERVGCARHEILKGIAFGEAQEIGCGVPSCKEVRRSRADFVVRLPLPLPGPDPVRSKAHQSDLEISQARSPRRVRVA